MIDNSTKLDLTTDAPLAGMQGYVQPFSEVFNEDCIDVMKRYPDKFFDLAIVDPPYGIGVDGAIHIRKPDRPSTWDMVEKYERKDWDNEIPKAEYWEQLFRVSKNQIVWGGNYFTEYLKPSKCWVFWDKQFDKTFNFSHGELAWTSFNKQLLKVTKSSKAETNGGKDRIHPTQKPVYIYDWLLNNFKEESINVLDTHVGSGSSRISCHKAGLSFVGCEIDKDYFDAQEKRFKEFVSQMRLF
jgi:site-specific DNA-methyltransferase (adenine-specific)